MKDEILDKENLKNNVFRQVSFLFYERILKPQSENEDLKRRELILNIFLIASIIFSFFLILIVAYQSMKLGPLYKGFTVGEMQLVFFGLISLYLLSRTGLCIIVSYLLVAIFFILTSYTVYHWGADVPEALLGYSFIIVMSGILINSRFAFAITLLTSLVLIITTYFQIKDIIHPALYWKPKTLGIKDAVQYSITLMIIAVASWLSNREMERSLKRARRSEIQLKEERDNLEIRVQERTRDLEIAQAEKLKQVTRFIEFGKISAGLFHDLVNHISFLFLNMGEMNQGENKEQELVQTKKYLEEANKAKLTLAEYIKDIRKQLHNQPVSLRFSLKAEILSAIRLLKHKATLGKININTNFECDALVYGNQVRLNHALVNLILNSIDAYEEKFDDNEKREINVTICQLCLPEKVLIFIEDQAGGIPLGMQDKIFLPFFSTKNLQKGTGIGLATTKSVIEEDFGGTIYFESVPNVGTKFTIEIPLRDPSSTSV